MNTVKIKSYAKVNLTLDVVGARDGYHLIDSFASSVELFNLVVASKRKDKLVSGKMKGMGMDSVPFENTNACKVAEAFIEKFGVFGADISIYENIPVGAGLGGSSADAAGVLRALAKLYDVPKTEIYEIANRFGSDIAYMIDGGYARMQGCGELVTAVRESAPLHLLILCPESTVSAGACYREFDRFSAGRTPIRSTERALSLYESGDVAGLAQALKNDLTDGAVALNRDVAVAIEELKSFSPLGVCMTGSGSAVFAVFETREFCEWAKSRYQGNYRAIVTRTVGQKVVSDNKKNWKNPFALSMDE